MVLVSELRPPVGSEVRELGNWIGGVSRPAFAWEWLDDVAPATGRVHARIPRSDAADVEAAVQAAKAAQPGWAALSHAERAAWLDRIAEALEAASEAVAQLESADTGKPITLARTVDAVRPVANFRFFAGAIRHDETGFQRMGDALNYTLRQPVGIAGLITPWNLPLYLLSWKIAPAIAMGNTVVAKPSELTPLTADLLMQVLAEVGLPDGVVNLVHGLGPEAGQPILEHPDVRLISFTGGTATGERVAMAAAPRFKKLGLELGGKNPTLVFADCDLERTVEGVVRAGFLNQGQVCLCGSRILIERPLYEEFRDQLVERVSGMVVGDPADEATELGALVSAAHRDKVEGYIALAQEEGGTLLTGGGRPTLDGELAGGSFVLPTIVEGLAVDSRCATEEIFGPVVTLHPFDDEEEAVAIANGVDYGLAASVWTSDLETAHRVPADLDCGMVWVNTWLHRDLRVPFGGTKASGVGREGGHHSLEFFSESKNVCVHLGGPW